MASFSMNPITLTTAPSEMYALIDSGREEKLERYGAYILARPDPSALWEKKLPESEWKKADAWYERKERGGAWHSKGELPQEWPIAFGGFTFLIRPTSFKHVGLFPEQLLNWQWVEKKLKAQSSPLKAPKVLNLFAYTGGATLAAAEAGAEVTHVDASKTANLWARENAVQSNLSDKPIRWITDDVLAFAKKEIRRGVRYDGIIMDPPAFGHGPKNELWKIERDYLTLLESCKNLLSDTPLFMLMSGYASGYSSYAFSHNLLPFKKQYGGVIEHGELAIAEEGSERVLPSGIFARIAFP